MAQGALRSPLAPRDPVALAHPYAPGLQASQLDPDKGGGGGGMALVNLRLFKGGREREREGEKREGETDQEREGARGNEREKERGESGQKFSTISVPQRFLCKVKNKKVLSLPGKTFSADRPYTAFPM